MRLTKRSSVLIVVLACILVFGRAAAFQFSGQDDGVNIGLNPYLCSWSGLAHLWTHAYDRLYIPVTYTFWSALCEAAYPVRDSIRPDWVYHGVNVLVHVLNSVLVLLLVHDVLARRPAERQASLTPKRDTPDAALWPAALLGALIFACHPVQAEAVAWATGFKDLIAATFSLLALGSWLKLRDRAMAGPRELMVAILGPTLLFALACLSKPSSVTLPAAAAALEWGLGAPRWKRALRELSGWLVVAAVVAAITISAHYGAAEEPYSVPWLARLPEATGNLATYLRAVFAFHFITVTSPRPIAEYLYSIDFWVLATIGAAAALLFWLGRRRFPLAASGAFIFVAGVLSVLGFISFHHQEVFSDTADRYAYFAMTGVALAGAAGVRSLRALRSRWPAGADLAIPIAVVLLVAMGGLAFVRAAVWRNGLAYVDATGRGVTDPGYYGLQLLEAGRDEEGVAQLKQAYEKDPKNLNNWQHMVSALAFQGADQEIIKLCRDSIVANPRHALAHFALGHMLALVGQYKPAYDELTAATGQVRDIGQMSFPPVIYLAITHPERYPRGLAVVRDLEGTFRYLPSLIQLEKVLEIESKYPGKLPRPPLQMLFR